MLPPAPPVRGVPVAAVVAMNARNVIAALVIACAAGCSATKRAADLSAKPPQPSEGLLLGEVVRVNAALGYLVMECAALPSPDEEATVCRGNRVVGRVRVTPPVSTDVVACDLVSGEARRGDKVRRDRRPTPPATGTP
jgi:hypothetical protein